MQNKPDDPKPDVPALQNLFGGFGVVRFLRYAIGGFWVPTLLWISGHGDKVKDLVGTLTAAFAIPTAIIVGGVNYVLVRHFLGTFLIYPACQKLHRWAEQIVARFFSCQCFDRCAEKMTDAVFVARGLKDPFNTTSIPYLMELMGVPFGLRNAACGTIRAKLFEGGDREFIDVLHSELHMLWIVAVDLAVISFLGVKEPPAWWIGAVLCIMAAFADAYASSLVCGRLRHRHDEVRKALEESGYIRPDQELRQSEKITFTNSPW